MIDVSLTEAVDFPSLATRWAALESRARASFFQSWTWTGCLVQERFPDPVLVEARSGGATVGLALFNRRRGLGRDRLYLGETGMQPQDGLYIEHNGPLVAADQPDSVTQAMLAAAGRDHDLILSGLSDAGRAAAAVVGVVVPLKATPAPFADLAATRADGGGYLGRRSANTRQQIRRSDRAFAALGPVTLTRADSAALASAWLEEMAVLHQATWVARGRPGAFAGPFFARFHHALIARGMAAGHIDLLRVTAGEQVVGILYNFRYRGRAMAYQSGFAYDPDQSTRRPGLTCHHQAIRYCLAEGLETYDFLAGDDRYKRSLADGADILHWVLAGSPWSPRIRVTQARAWLRDRRHAIASRERQQP